MSRLISYPGVLALVPQLSGSCLSGILAGGLHLSDHVAGDKHRVPASWDTAIDHGVALGLTDLFLAKPNVHGGTNMNA